MRVFRLVRAPLIFLLPVVVVTVAGCSGGGLEKSAISGRITFQGQPIEDGQIRFVPIKGTKGPATVGTIRGGNYTATARGGVPVGTLRVEVEAYRPLPGAMPYTKEQAEGNRGVVAGDYPKKQFLPSKYNTNSTLEVTIESGNKTVTKDIELR
jgi:hypothetical protein